MAYATPGPVISIETDFIPKGEQILRAAQQTTRILQRQLNIVEPTMEQTGKRILQEHTPLGPDAWHHKGGQSDWEQYGLSGSTEAFVQAGDGEYTAMEGVTGIGGVIEQLEISFAQPSENPYGTQYAPFVILGHRTRGGSFVPANPYPTEAMIELQTYMNTVLDAVARTVAVETVAYMAYGGTV